MKFSYIWDKFKSSNKEILALVFFKSSTKSYSRLFKREVYEDFVPVEVDFCVVDDFLTSSGVEGESDVESFLLLLVL